MRRLTAFSICTAVVLALTACAPSLDETRLELQESIEEIPGVDAVRVDAFAAVVYSDDDIAAEDAREIMEKTRALMVELEEEPAPVYLQVMIPTPQDHGVMGEWQFAALHEDSFEQQARFLSTLVGWPAIDAPDSPLERVVLVVGEPGPTSFSSIKAHQTAGDASEEVRSQLLDLWVQSGGEPDVWIRWMGRA